MKVDHVCLRRSRLGYRLLRNDGGVWGGEPVDQEGSVVLRSTEIAADGRWVRLEEAARRVLSPRDASLTRLSQGDLLVTKASGSPEHIGKTALVSQEVASMRPSFSNFMQRLRVDNQMLDAAYAFRFLQSSDARQQMAELGTTSTGLMNLSASLLNDLMVPELPLDEQRRIADFLDDQVTRIDQAIELSQRQISVMSIQRRVKLVTLMFSGTIRTEPLNHLAQVALGRQRSPENHEGPHMTPYLRSANVTDGRILLEDVKQMNFDPKEKVRFALRVGDVLVTEGAGSRDSVGASALWTTSTETYCFQNTLIRVRPRDDKVLPEYLGYWARASHAAGAMRTWATGANILHLGADGLARMPVPARSVAEQNRIVCSANESEVLSREVEMHARKRLQLLQERKRALITACVTGEFDVSTASNRASEAVIR